MNMNTYIISYDMAEDGDYTALIDKIKSYRYWAHITESTWAILSYKSASDIRDDLADHFSIGSRLIVVQTAHIAAWMNTKCSNKWLEKNI